MIVRVDNKKHSDKLIKSLGLNYVPYKVFEGNTFTEENIKEFTQGRKTLWNVRDYDSYSGNFRIGLTEEQICCLDINKNAKIKISESMKKYDLNNMVIQGDIFVDNKLNVIGTVSKVKGETLREVTNNPSMFETIRCNIVNEKINVGIRSEIHKIIDYICEHNLFNVIVEFSMYDCSVGITGDNIIVWELRTR